MEGVYVELSAFHPENEESRFFATIRYLNATGILRTSSVLTIGRLDRIISGKCSISLKKTIVLSPPSLHCQILKMIQK